MLAMGRGWEMFSAKTTRFEEQSTQYKALALTPGNLGAEGFFLVKEGGIVLGDWGGLCEARTIPVRSRSSGRTSVRRDCLDCFAGPGRALSTALFRPGTGGKIRPDVALLDEVRVE